MELLRKAANDHSPLAPFTSQFAPGRSAILTASMTALILLVSCSPYRSDREWQRSYRLAFAEPVALLPQLDSGFTICGWQHTGDSIRDRGILVVRCDQNADTLWTRVLLDKEHIGTEAVCAAPNGGCYVGGYGGDLSGIVARLDANGDTVWVRRLSRDWNSVSVAGALPDSRRRRIGCRVGHFRTALSSPAFSPRRQPLDYGDTDSSISGIKAICPTADGWALAGYTKELPGVHHASWPAGASASGSGKEPAIVSKPC